MVTQNIVRAATWLLFTLAGTSGIFFLLGADFVGATQLLVYVGGTLVLVVFGVMLTAQGPFINMKTSGAEWADRRWSPASRCSAFCASCTLVRRPLKRRRRSTGRRGDRTVRTPQGSQPAHSPQRDPSAQASPASASAGP